MFSGFCDTLELIPATGLDVLQPLKTTKQEMSKKVIPFINGI
jgi:hypothetical protein